MQFCWVQVRWGRIWVLVDWQAGPCMVSVHGSIHMLLPNYQLAYHPCTTPHELPCTDAMHHAQPSWPSQKCHAPMPCTARLARQPKPKFNPSGLIRNRTTLYCCYYNFFQLFVFLILYLSLIYSKPQGPYKTASIAAWPLLRPRRVNKISAKIYYIK